MTPDPAPQNPLEAIATLDVDTAELKTATLGLLIAGKRFLTAIGKGALVSVEVGGETPIRIHVRDKPTAPEEA